jgi:hypothetical protein
MAWTSRQCEEFGALLLALGEVFEAPVSTVRAELFTRAVEDLPFDAVKDAANTYARTGTFFPKPVDLRALADGMADLTDRAETAWTAVLREVRRVGYLGTPMLDDVTFRTATGLFGGGWRTLCEHLPADGAALIGYPSRRKSATSGRFWSGSARP